MCQFSDTVLEIMERIYNNPKIIEIFFDNIQHQETKFNGDLSNKIKNNLLEIIRFLVKIFEDRKVLFIRNLLSHDDLLISLFQIAKK